MSRNAQRRLPPASPGETPPVSRLQLQEFARRLYQEMQKRGWSQSDLARAAFGSHKNPEGYTVARGRDRVSVYLRGLQAPDPKNLAKIAKALGVAPEELAPDLFATAIDREHPEIAIHQATGNPGRVHLVVNKIVPAHLAAQIFALLSPE